MPRRSQDVTVRLPAAESCIRARKAACRGLVIQELAGRYPELVQNVVPLSAAAAGNLTRANVGQNGGLVAYRNWNSLRSLLLTAER